MTQNRDRKLIKVSASGEVSEITEAHEYEETKYRTQCAWVLMVPEKWEHKRTFKLSMTMIDRFSEFDPLNIQATCVVANVKIPIDIRPTNSFKAMSIYQTKRRTKSSTSLWTTSNTF